MKTRLNSYIPRVLGKDRKSPLPIFDHQNSNTFGIRFLDIEIVFCFRKYEIKSDVDTLLFI